MRYPPGSNHRRRPGGVFLWVRGIRSLIVVQCLFVLVCVGGCAADEVNSGLDASAQPDSMGMDDRGTLPIDMGTNLDASRQIQDRGISVDATRQMDAAPVRRDAGRDAAPNADVFTPNDVGADSAMDAATPDAGCSAFAELCNGMDDDCDGVADEGFDLGGECVVGELRCGLPGTWVCDAGGAAVCQPNPMATPISSPEVCNGLDDDCDDRVDENNPEGGAACNTDQAGRCRAGTQTCIDGRLDCRAEHQPRQELCDGLDDDCDGEVDNVPPVAGCETGRQGVCARGRLECNAGELRCLEIVEGEVETCDALDNDCDGSTDEDPTDIGQNCNTGRRGECRAGRQACVDGARRCVSILDAVPELCDERDQDCDGRIDEDSEGAGVACDPGWATPDCQRRALMECQAGDLICVRDPRPEDPCDGLDTDCDGRIGEDILGQECRLAAAGQCELGSMICEEGAPMCIASFEPGCELMNDLDDDCDGEIDEAPQRFCSPAETQVGRFCLDDNNRIAGFDMVVDPYGEIWAVRANITSGSVYLSHILHDGTEEREQVYGRTAIVGNFPMRDAAITLYNDAPAVCFWKATTGTLFTSIRGQDGQWQPEEILDRDTSGEECDIATIDGQLVVAYRDANALWWATRQGEGQWQTQRIDAPGSSAGHDLELLVHDGVPYIAHTDPELGRLRITYQSNGAWRTAVVMADSAIGYRPRLTILGQWLYVIHGERPLLPDRGGDSSLLFTELHLPDMDQEETMQLSIAGQGGSQALMPYGDGLLALSRIRLRDAVFGDQDGLEFRKVVSGSTVNPLETHGLAQRRHTFTRLRLAPDPFGLPIVGFVDEGGSIRGDPGFGRVCFYRPNDGDGDHIPDVSELELGTDPDRADSDGDGRTDGQEVLHDGTDPLRR